LVIEPGPQTTDHLLLRAGDPVIAAAGDIACDPTASNFSACNTQATSDLLVGSGLAAVLTLGDHQDDDGVPEKYQVAYDPTWGRLKAITHPVPGDDDYATPGAAGYYNYFGEMAGPGNRGYYSYDIGTWHVIALNSNCSQIGGCQPGSPQERWLRADLAAHRNRCVLAYWHEPRFSSGPHGNNQALRSFWNLLYTARADVVLNAHGHHYERFAPQNPFGAPDPARGIRQFVVGTGGTLPQAVNQPVPNSEVLHTGDAGILELTLHPDGYDWWFVPAGGARFSDAGSGACH
jgi:acid phosphatase type 7